MVQLRDIEIEKAWLSSSDQGNPLLADPRRYWSQSDEDGILERILDRLGQSLPAQGSFIEFGVGDGTENNTLALLARGWSGTWVGGEELIFPLPPASRLKFVHAWLSLRNIADVVQSIQPPGLGEVSVVSVDLDGNDFYFVELLLSLGLQPAVWVVEYNAIFPPGVEWVMPYREDHVWQGDDYYGASLTSYVRLFEHHGYFLVGCSIAGTNAFFVRSSEEVHFRDIPRSLIHLYRPARHHLVSSRSRKPSTSLLTSLASPYPARSVYERTAGAPRQHDVSGQRRRDAVEVDSATLQGDAR
jgi:hypothetical protein